MYENDKRTVLTLDAGGTNFVFLLLGGIFRLFLLFVCLLVRTIWIDAWLR